MGKLTYLLMVILILDCGYALADTYIPLGSPVYGYLKRLDAEGVIDSAMLSTLPISRLAGAKLTTEAMEHTAGTDSSYLRDLVAKLGEEFKVEIKYEQAIYLKPLDAASAEYAYSDHLSFFRQKNRDGVAIKKGNNGLVGVTTEFDSPYLGLMVTPELRVYDDETFVKLKKWYALLNLGREEFFFGKESAWWGPGENGTLLLSNNAEPVTMVKISNSIPYDILRVGFRGTFFISRLESDRRDIQSPIFFGIRLDFKPVRFLEVGLAKTAIFGGKGRREEVGTFIKSLVGKGGNDLDDSGDQRAGYDVKLTIPFSYQPVTLYFEGAGEDEAGGLPTKWAYVYGAYLPRVSSLERLELRGEYARTIIAGHPGAWYSHHTFTQGYTFKGRVIGHYIGADAKDLFLWGRYNFDSAALSVSYERLKRDFPVNLDWEDYGVSYTKELFEGGEVELSGNYSREDRKNFFVRVGFNCRL